MFCCNFGCKYFNTLIRSETFSGHGPFGLLLHRRSQGGGGGGGGKGAMASLEF